ncbi:hypothetical protein [Staphylococcus phage vB_StaM_PB50]|nr:hypothetical protein [Staphylococcus phage vB_StaM_PB50]
MSKPFISKYRQSQADLNKKANKALEQKKYNDMVNEELQVSKEKDLISGRNNQIKATNKRAIDNAKNKNDRDLLSLNTQTIMTTLFSALVFNTFPNKIADKSKLRDHIVNKSRVFFNEAIDAELADYQGSEVFKNAKFNAATYAKDAHGVIDPKDSIKGAKVVYKKGSTEFDYLVNVVAKKIESAVIRESELVEVREKLNEGIADTHKKQSKTFFRTLHEMAINDIVNNEEYLKEEISAEEVNMNALTEAVLDYTIMELVHTAKLSTFDMSEVQKSIKNGSLKVNTSQSSKVNPENGSTKPSGDGVKPRVRDNENKPKSGKVQLNEE